MSWALKTMKIGVIGTGNWGGNLVRNFAALEVLAAVADPVETNRAKSLEDAPVKNCDSQLLPQYLLRHELCLALWLFLSIVRLVEVFNQRGGINVWNVFYQHLLLRLQASSKGFHIDISITRENNSRNQGFAYSLSVQLLFCHAILLKES